MRKLLLLLLICATPCFAQKQLSISSSGVVQANVDSDGWKSFKVTLTQNVTAFQFVGFPPPAQGSVNVIFTQDATGGRTIAFTSWTSPSGNVVSVSNPCIVTSAANATTICAFNFDGTSNNWNGAAGNNVFPDLVTKNTPVIDVRAYGAKGDGTTDDTVAIQAAMNACNTSGGGTVLIPFTTNGYVIRRGTTAGTGGAANQQGGINGYPGCSLLSNGQSTKLILRSNNAFIYYDPSIFGTTTAATITADTIVGQTNFTVNSSTGFAVGDDVYFRLGNDVAQVAESAYFGFAKISAIPDGTHITLDRPLNRAMTIAATGATNRQIFKFSVGFVQNIEIGGFNLVTDQVNSGNAEYGALCRYCRNVQVHDIQATDPGAGAVYFQFSDNVRAVNISVLSSFALGAYPNKGRGGVCSECNNANFENYRISKFDSNGIDIEASSKNVRIKGMQLINNSTAGGNIYGTQLGGDCEVWIDDYRLEGNPLTDEVGYGGSNGQAYINAMTMNITGMVSMNQRTLANMTGRFNWINGNANVSTMYGSYRTPLQWSGQLLLAPSATNQINTPDGIYKKMRIFANSVTGITGTFVLGTANHNSGDLTSQLSAGNNIDITAADTLSLIAGASNSNTWGLTGKALQVFTNGTVPAGTYMTVWIEYYPLDGAASTRVAAQQDTTNVVTSNLAVGGGTTLAKYSRFSVSLSPVAVAANTCAAQSFTVTGIAAADILISVSKPTEQAGLSVAPGHVTGANTATINFCNTTAGAITPTAAETYQFVVVQ